MMLGILDPTHYRSAVRFREGELGVSSWEGASLRDTETVRDLSR
jgi:hypothetical protein